MAIGGEIVSVYAPGNWDWCDSYGLIACQLARHFDRLGVHVNAIGLGETRMDNQPPDIERVVCNPIKPVFGGIALGYPTIYKHFGPMLSSGKPRIALTMFESSRIPPDWVPILNSLEAVIVPSTFCEEVFLACGVTSAIYKIPLGISEIYKPRTRTSDRPITFLAFLDRGKRKGALLALRAFITAFGEDTRYRLILKGRANRGVPVQITNPNIEVIQKDYTEQELCDLYYRCDVLINPTSGEGFGLLPREFSATGGISLTTPWSGTADNLRSWGWEIPYSLVKADWRGIKKFEELDLGQWASPSVEGISKRLQEIAESIQDYLRAAQEKAIIARKLYTWERFGRETLGIWREYCGNRYAKS